MTEPQNSGAALLRPIGDNHWPPSLDHLRESFATRLNVYRTMAHNPPLVAAWESLRNHIVLTSALGPEKSEIVILRCGVHWQSAYELAHHVHRAKAIGFDDERLNRLTGALEGISGDDRIIAGAADELLRHGRLDAAALIELQALLGHAAILDLMATIGLYTTLAFVVNSFETPIDDGVR